MSQTGGRRRDAAQGAGDEPSLPQPVVRLVED
jgi:hypothetical protein